jgi:hypothetical protein
VAQQEHRLGQIAPERRRIPTIKYLAANTERSRQGDRAAFVAGSAARCGWGHNVRHLIVATLMLAACLAVAAPGPGHCKPIDPGPAIAGLPANEILNIIRSRGFEPIGPPVRRPGLYVVLALDSYDRVVRLTVDARSARVVAVRPASMAPAMVGYGPPPVYPAYGRGGYAYGNLADRFGDPAVIENAIGAPPLPPRYNPTPQPRAPQARNATAVLPLPRPRPADATGAQEALTPPKAQTGTAMPPVTPLE